MTRMTMQARVRLPRRLRLLSVKVALKSGFEPRIESSRPTRRNRQSTETAPNRPVQIATTLARLKYAPFTFEFFSFSFKTLVSKYILDSIEGLEQ